VARLVAEGLITDDEAISHPQKNVILHSLGSENRATIDLFHLEVSEGERLILCTDGLTRHVTDDEIAAAVSANSPERAATMLIQLANAKGGEDNISVAIVEIREASVLDS
jgi:protein phosphatase